MDFLSAIQTIKSVGGYIAVAPANVIAFANGYRSSIYEVEFDPDTGPSAEFEQTLKQAEREGVTVLDIRDADSDHRAQVLMVVSLLGMPNPQNSEDVAFLGEEIAKAGGHSYNLPETDPNTVDSQ